MGMGSEWGYNEVKRGIRNGNRNEPVGMEGNGINKIISAHLYRTFVLRATLNNLGALFFNVALGTSQYLNKVNIY